MPDTSEPQHICVIFDLDWFDIHHKNAPGSKVVTWTQKVRQLFPDEEKSLFDWPVHEVRGRNEVCNGCRPRVISLYPYKLDGNNKVPFPCISQLDIYKKTATLGNWVSYVGRANTCTRTTHTPHSLCIKCVEVAIDEGNMANPDVFFEQWEKGSPAQLKEYIPIPLKYNLPQKDLRKYIDEEQDPTLRPLDVSWEEFMKGK
jgi:hypothetical protein